MDHVLLDATGLIKRAIMASALDDLRAGLEFTGGVFGALASLRSILAPADIRASRIIAFFDHGVPPRRLRLLPYYKSKRKESRALLSDDEKQRAYKQMGVAKRLFKTLGILCLEYVDREADDAVAAAAKILGGQGKSVVVVTGDKDLWQCCLWGSRVWDISKKAWVTSENFRDTAGVPVECYVLYKALVGDPSDSLPGVKGVGAKTALKLVIEHEDALVAHDNPLDQFAVLRRLAEGKIQEKIVADYRRVRREIQGIDLSASFGGVKKFTSRLKDRQPYDERAFRGLCKRLKFMSVLRDPSAYVRPFKRAFLDRESKE